MSTIKDVSKLAGVSPATVSRVINNANGVSAKTKEKVKQAIAELDFYPNAQARALVKQSTNTIGVVMSELSDPFFAIMARSIEITAEKYNANVLISTGSLNEEKERQAINSLQAQRCKAMVVNSKILSDEELIDFAHKIPGFVLINKYIEAIQERCIWLDNQQGGFNMAQYILEMGHSNVLVLSTKNKVYDASRRLAGIQSAFTQAHKILPANHIIYTSPDPQGGEKAIEQALANGIKFTAVLAYNDAVAVGAVAKLTEKGLSVPENVSVIGFDDVLLANYCSPPLTTVKYPIAVMSQKATELALTLSKNEGKVSQTINTYKYKPIIIKRSSVSWG
ncbi:LacI family DNA-binding transcriptional regulator [Catenovulum adriaticum]|uniref:LacI family DNA-binding transcriptional regulator n=1 Tax=Catenovulum adriaticum TaxID=2984846 RepID=A0ABY7AQQ1_9ALTE|nr:LacI family DNA-binding transcriptional regulator [Catenovulum sp. TS8]WAJ71814.1 LacI family DNA-binding transcriptional regulator [Catenovulum sp. TS8]